MTAIGIPGAGAAYSAARRGAIVVERADRVQVRAHGRDPARMIQGLITNDLDDATAERAVYAAMLTPKGRMVADMRIVREPDGSMLIDLDSAALEAMLAHVKKYVPPMFARFEPVDQAPSVLGVYGPGAASVLRAAGFDASEDAREYDVLRDPRGLAIATRESGEPGFDLFASPDQAESIREVARNAGAVDADAATLELLRLEAGRPRWGAELDADRIPLEAGLRERAISTSKGCYTGQEVIIRILHRGHVNWNLRGLLLGDAAPPEAGGELAVETGGKTVARVTSAARSPAAGQTIALAYVRREIEPGAILRLADGTAATVTDLPFHLQAE